MTNDFGKEDAKILMIELAVLVLVAIGLAFSFSK
jgi:hypothetical protein